MNVIKFFEDSIQLHYDEYYETWVKTKTTSDKNSFINFEGDGYILESVTDKDVIRIDANNLT